MALWYASAPGKCEYVQSGAVHPFMEAPSLVVTPRALHAAHMHGPLSLFGFGSGVTIIAPVGTPSGLPISFLLPAPGPFSVEDPLFFLLPSRFNTDWNGPPLAKNTVCGAGGIGVSLLGRVTSPCSIGVIRVTTSSM